MLKFTQMLLCNVEHLHNHIINLDSTFKIMSVFLLITQTHEHTLVCLFLYTLCTKRDIELINQLHKILFGFCDLWDFNPISGLLGMTSLFIYSSSVVSSQRNSAFFYFILPLVFPLSLATL